MFTAHGSTISGNCYKIKLLMEQAGLPYQWHEVDIFKGESHTPEFLAKNPNGRVPVLELAPDRYLPESNAILVYLAEDTRFWPEDKFLRAQVLQWLFFEQYSHEPYIAVARFIKKFLPAEHPRQQEIPRLHERGYSALDVMEKHLAIHNYFVGGIYSIADIALYAYTHTAHDGGFDLSHYPAIKAWLQRVAAQPGHVPQ